MLLPLFIATVSDSVFPLQWLFILILNKEGKEIGRVKQQLQNVLESFYHSKQRLFPADVAEVQNGSAPGAVEDHFEVNYALT